MEKRVKTYLGNSNNQLTNLNSNFVFVLMFFTSNSVKFIDFSIITGRYTDFFYQLIYKTYNQRPNLSLCSRRYNLYKMKYENQK